MDLQQVAMTEFVLLQASWPVEKSRQLIERLNPSHVIVHRSEAHNDYYLLTVEEALNLLTNANNASSVAEALHLEERPAVPALEGSTDAESAPDRCIVLEDGQ